LFDINLHIAELDLSIEDRHRGNCPICNGRNTFTVSRTLEGVLYNCYKAGCSLSGVKSTFVTVQDAMKRKATPKKVHSFVLPACVLPKRKELAEWAIKNSLASLAGADLLYDVKEDRVVFPVLHDHKIVDATGRAVNKYTKPKWKRYGSSGYAYTVGGGDVAVVVEDCISAAVVARLVKNCVGLALMGTSLLPDHIRQLRDFRVVLVALDPDAAKKTLQFTSALRAQLNSSCVIAIKLEDDLKYARKNDILNIKTRIGEYNGIGAVTHTDEQRIL